MRRTYHYSTISEVGTLIREQEISPIEIVAGCLQRIEELNPRLNAFITVLNSDALDAAKRAQAEIQAGKWCGPLHGIPMAIKDFYDTAGFKTTAAFGHFKDRVPGEDAASVAKLKRAGAIIVGKTNMHTLGMGTTGLESFFGPVKNPWNSEYIPGGSSGGSAAAVASGLCYATVDTDAIGSCRLPAACCGVVGFKGTYGLIDMKGILEGEKPPDEVILWLSHAGITTRSVADTALVLDVLAEPSEHAETRDFLGDLGKRRKLRVGVANNFRADDEVSALFSKAVEDIQRLGYSMSKAAAPLLDLDRGIRNIRADREIIVEQAFQDIDVLILPTILTQTPSVEDVGTNPQALSPYHTVFANYYGLPALSLACGFDTHGLPIGLQIVGKPWDEGAVLRLAHEYEMATAHSNVHPIE